MKKLLSLFIAFVLTGLVLSSIARPYLTASSVSDPTDLRNSYAKWSEAVETAQGNPSGIMPRYAYEAILLPAFDDKILTTQEEIANYYATLTAKENIQISAKEFLTQAQGAIAISSGVQELSFVEKGQTKTFTLRFTFVYQKLGNKWIIINHHESLLPSSSQ